MKHSLIPQAVAFTLAVLIALLVEPARAASPGPIFPLFGGTQLATRPDGTTLLVETYDECVEPAHELHREVRVGSLAPGGTNLATYQVRSDVTYPGCRFPAYGPDIAVNATNALAAYVDKVGVIGGLPDEYLIGYFFADYDGNSTGQVMIAASSESWIDGWVATRVAMNRAGQFAMVWFDQVDVGDHFARGQVFDASGQPIGGGFTLNDQPRSDGRFGAHQAVVALAPNGSSVYSWEDAFLSRGSIYADYDPGHDIYARRVDSSGNPIGSQFRVNTTVNCRHSDAEIAVAGDGSFVIVWTQSSSDANGVYLQRFNAAANRLGSETRVSPYSGTDPQVKMIPDGRFIVAWQGQDGDGSGIFAQRFLAGGSFYGNTLWVNEGATNSQTKPLLGLADDGTFIVKWSEGVTNCGRWFSWEATNQTQILGPRIQVLSPAFSVAAPITNVAVTFDRLMNVSTFTTTNAYLIDPVGRIIPITSVQTTNSRTFTLSFASQHLPGRYHVRVGPNIQDSNGALMDENGNTIKGEAADIFFGQLILTSSVTATFPKTEGFEAGPDGVVGWSFDSFHASQLTFTANNAPHGGTQHLWFSDSANVSATLALDLSGQSGQTNLVLVFWAKGYSLLNVELSGDGETWFPMLSFDLYSTGLPNDYTEFWLDLDQAALSDSIALDSSFYVRFRFSNGASAYLDDVKVVAGELPLGPRVTGHSPMQFASSNSSLTSITVTFDKAIDPATFTGADVTLKDPWRATVSGVVVSPVAGTGNTQFALTFTPQSIRGEYLITVGPNIADAAGHLMNQNSNSANGETSDRYFGVVTFAPEIMMTSPGPNVMTETFEGWPPVPAAWSFTSFPVGVDSVALSALNPRHGTNQLVIGADGGDTSGGSHSAMAVLALDLSGQVGQTNLFLDFFARVSGNGSFFVEASSNAQTWVVLAGGAPSTYTQFTLDLDGALASNNISLTGTVYLRFRHTIGVSPYPQSGGALYLDDVRILAGQSPIGPKVIAVTPNPWSGTNNSLSNLSVTFDKAIDLTSLTAADVVLYDPTRTSTIPVTVTVAGSGNTQFNLTFPDQTLRGDYGLTVGPNITDPYGNWMNQNGYFGGVGPTEYYRGTVTFAPAAAPADPGPVLFEETFEHWPPMPSIWGFQFYPYGSGGLSTFSPHGGSNNLFIEADGGYTSAGSHSAMAVLALDLSGQVGQANLFLEFWAKSSYFFYVEVSNDSQTWRQILTAAANQYTQYSLDLDQALATNGISLTDTIYLRFRVAVPASPYPQVGQSLYLDDVRIVAPPALASPSRTGNGLFHFQLRGPTNSTWVVQASTNLTTWIPISTNTVPASGALTVTDWSATNAPIRFYRAVGVD